MHRVEGHFLSFSIMGMPAIPTIKLSDLASFKGIRKESLTGSNLRFSGDFRGLKQAPYLCAVDPFKFEQ